MLTLSYKIPFQPKKFNPFANHINAVDNISNNLARIDKGQVPKRTIITINKIVRNMLFITRAYYAIGAFAAASATWSTVWSITGATSPNQLVIC